VQALVRSRVPAVALVAGIVVFAIVAVPQLKVNADQLFFFKDDDPVRMAFERTEELFGGATPLVGEFVFDPATPEQSLEAARSASQELEQLDGVREVFSIAELADQLPPDQLQAVLGGQQTFPLGDMVSDDGLRFLLLPSDFTTEDLERWLAFAEQRDEIRVLTGLPVVWDEIARLVLDAQTTSLIVAFVLVAAMLAIAYRRWWDTLVSLVPITLPWASPSR
jgi:predicted RND superfamily exporter protein